MVKKARARAPTIPGPVSYVGSGEHKRYPNPLCPPALRSDASDCDAVDPSVSKDLKRLQRWLEAAINRGQVDRVIEGGYPRKAWGWLQLGNPPKRLLFETRLTNSVKGEYKGYFIELNDLSGKMAWVHKMLAEEGDWWGILA